MTSNGINEISFVAASVGAPSMAPASLFSACSTVPALIVFFLNKLLRTGEV